MLMDLDSMWNRLSAKPEGYQANNDAVSGVRVCLFPRGIFLDSKQSYTSGSFLTPISSFAYNANFW